MARSPLITGLLVLGALLLFTNPIWLFPAEGETRHTYTRVPVEVDEDRLMYDPPDDGADGQFNDLEGIGCDYSENQFLPRGCAFDYHLIDHGPVTVAGNNVWRFRPQFAVLNGTYYERIKRGGTFDVQRTSPANVLDELAHNASALPSEPGYESFELNLVRHGGTRRSSNPPQDHTLGRIYKVRGNFYAIALVESATLDRPLVSPILRILLDIVGGGLFALAGLRISWSRQDARISTR